MPLKTTGPGIADEILPAIFQPFVQAPNHVPGEGGTGLGLAITGQFVQLMGGTLEVTTCLGQGSTFQFQIPVTLVDPAEVMPPARRRVVKHLAPDQPTYRLLVVDDRAENREPLIQLLQSVGFATQTASTGAEALAQWHTWRPHLIWMDMRMPEMDGYEATRQIRAQEALGNVPPTRIIALTASAFDDQRQDVFAAGCDDFICKPFQVSVIFDKLVEHLGIRFLYGDRSYSDRPAPGSPPEICLPEVLLTMPPAWVQELRQAAIQADADWLRHLIAQVPGSLDALTTSLNAWVDGFDFDAIVDLTEGGADG